MRRSGAFKAVFALLCLFLLAGLAHQSQAFPKPSLVPRGWLLDFAYSQPRPTAIRTPTGEVRWFWYVTYKVTNRSGQDRLWIPEFTVATDTGHIITANAGIPPEVFDAIAAKESNPLLESPVDVVGRLLQGEDFARESVAIWPAPEGDVDYLDLFVAGLSGETQALDPNRYVEIIEPAGDAETNGEAAEAEGSPPVAEPAPLEVFDPEAESASQPERPERIIVRRTLMISYHFPGGRTHPQAQTVLPLGDQWVMR